jgi:AFG3 family protein
VIPCSTKYLSLLQEKKLTPDLINFINIGSAETFERKLDEAEKNFTLSEKIPVSYVKKTSWFWDIMAWVLPVVLIFSLWSILMRRRGGMGMGTGGSSEFIK